MNIIILGAGSVGASLAGHLVQGQQEGCAVTVVDSNADCLMRLQENFDLRTVHGCASYPQVLREAGAEQADMLVAVTSSDETNIVSCQVAKALFNTPTCIARVRSEEYLRFREELFQPQILSIDHLITPEAQVIDQIYLLIEFPGALQVSSFANKSIGLVSVKAHYGGPMVGCALSLLKVFIPHVAARVIAIFRGDKFIRPLETTVIEADDEVMFISAYRHIRAVMALLQRLDRPYRRCMIIGGGNIGSELAKKLACQCQVKLIERDPIRARYLAEKLPKVTIFCGDGADKDLLVGEGVDQVDLFIAVTGEDQGNIMSAMLAKQLGAKKNMVLMRRSSYIELVRDGAVDLSIAPQYTNLAILLAYLHRGVISTLVILRHGELQVFETTTILNSIAHSAGDCKLGDLKLPYGVAVVALTRSQKIIFPDETTSIMAGDQLIILSSDIDHLVEIENILQASPANPRLMP